MNNEPEVTFPVPDARPRVERPPRRRGRPPTGKVPIKHDTTLVPCPECKKSIQRNYLSQHRRKLHGVVQRRSKNDVAPLSGEDVVRTVLNELFPNGVPVEHLDAIIRWHNATVEFVQEVQR